MVDHNFKHSRRAAAWTMALLAFIATITTVSSFGIIQPISTYSTVGRLRMHLSATTYKAKPPKFNKQTARWEPSAETEAEVYGPWGSFLRGGPAPFVQRVFNQHDYDQAVFKYMAKTSCSRAEAQGNMDAYYNNAADWSYKKSEEARGRPTVDYTELKPQQAMLVIGWASLVTPFLGRCAYLIAFGAHGWGLTLDDVFAF